MNYRRRFGATLALGSMVLQGCYASLPLQQDPPALTEPRVELVLNDQGRAALSGKLGAAVDKVEGQLVAVNGGSYELSVFHIKQLNGGSATWNGEHVTLTRDQIVGFQIRRLDKAKTAIAAGLIAAGILAVYLGSSLSGSGADKAVDPGTGGQSVIIVP
jgi:hypothetical protein